MERAPANISLGSTISPTRSPLQHPSIMLPELVGRNDSNVVVQPPLSQAVGYVVVVVIRLIIAVIMVFVTKLLKRTVGEDNRKTEM